MSIFEPPPTDTAIQVREWIEFRPVNQLGEDAAIEFHVPPQSTGYMDLKLCRLNVKIKITKADETSVTRDDVVSLINLPLHGMLSQIECQLQQKSVSDVGTNYPYKAYIDTLMTTDESIHVFNSSQLFIKDTSGQSTLPMPRRDLTWACSKYGLTREMGDYWTWREHSSWMFSNRID